jgi:hypothetical protein
MRAVGMYGSIVGIVGMYGSVVRLSCGTEPHRPRSEHLSCHVPITIQPTAGPWQRAGGGLAVHPRVPTSRNSYAHIQGHLRKTPCTSPMCHALQSCPEPACAGVKALRRTSVRQLSPGRPARTPSAGTTDPGLPTHHLPVSSMRSQLMARLGLLGHLGLDRLSAASGPATARGWLLAASTGTSLGGAAGGPSGAAGGQARRSSTRRTLQPADSPVPRHILEELHRIGKHTAM